MTRTLPVVGLTIAATALAAAGCHHTFHPTHVEPGGRVELSGAAVHVTPKHPGGGDPAGEPGTGYDAELAFGYGQRSGSGGAGILYEVLIPLQTYFFDAMPRETWIPLSFGVFAEADLVPRRFAIGIGGILGLRPGAYAQAGLRWPLGRATFSLDGGGGLDVGGTRALFGGLTVHLPAFDVGAWIDTAHYPDDVHEGDDPTDLTYAKDRLAGGIVVRTFFSRPRPAPPARE